MRNRYWKQPRLESSKSAASITSLPSSFRSTDERQSWWLWHCIVWLLRGQIGCVCVPRSRRFHRILHNGMHSGGVLWVWIQSDKCIYGHLVICNLRLWVSRLPIYMRLSNGLTCCSQRSSRAMMSWSRNCCIRGTIPDIHCEQPPGYDLHEPSYLSP